MRASRSEPTGSSSVHYVVSVFERLGWGPLENSSHDLGTDLFLQARDERRFDRGLFVGAQAKGG